MAVWQLTEIPETGFDVPIPLNTKPYQSLQASKQENQAVIRAILRSHVPSEKSSPTTNTAR
ncbi:hypothetical protein CCP4SC76_740004 [Gammaproteobacteria bacterium]